MSPLDPSSSLVAIFLVGLMIDRATSIGYWAAESTDFESKYSTDEYEYDDNYNILVEHEGQPVNSTLTQNGHYQKISVVVSAFGEKFLLDLRLNTYLFASNYIEKSVTRTGDVYHVVDHVQSHCYYIGTVRDRAESTAAASTCNGLVGYFAIGNRTYHIDPRSAHLRGDHAVYRSRGNDKTIYKCGSDHIVFNNLYNSAKSKTRLKRSFNWPQDKDKQDKVLEFYVANSYSQFVQQGSDVSKVTSRTKDIVNFASSTYQPLGIYWVLVGVEVWTDSERFSISSTDVDGVLNRWYAYRMANITPRQYNDNAVLITAVGYSGGVIGKAIIGGMCSNQYSGAVISDLKPSVSAAGSTMAHEVGHTFGLIHDSDSCSCVDKGGHCIMYYASNLGQPAMNWSKCSVDQFDVSFGKGKDACLYNAPATIYQPSSNCGNGIVETGEDCDCGRSSSSDCNSNCCNSTTCKLTRSATCASGRCCDISSCKILAADRNCRSKSDDCDLAEFCSGTSNDCPADTYKPDGTNCTTNVNGDMAYCYQGLCQSHLSQCQLLWGEGTKVSAERCYYMFNVYGLHYGNCGLLSWLPNISYIPCAKSDTMCGKLQCQDNSKQLVSYPDYYLLSTAQIGEDTCHSVIIDLGVRVQDPGLVPNGAKCGDGMMCISQKCVNVSLSTPSNPSNPPCGGSCATDEFCNNLGFCQRMDGASRPQSGSTKANVGLIVGLCVFFIVVLPLLVGAAILIYMYRHRLAECIALNGPRDKPEAVRPVSIHPWNDVNGNIGHTNPVYPTRPAPPQPPPAFRQAPPPPMAWDKNYHLSTYENNFNVPTNQAQPHVAFVSPSDQNGINARVQQRRQQLESSSAAVPGGDNGRPRPAPKPKGQKTLPPVRPTPPPRPPPSHFGGSPFDDAH